jgi:hypothetical protein
MAGDCERGCALCREDGDEMDEVCAVHVGGDAEGAGRISLNVCFIGPPIGQGGDRVDVWTELGDEVTAQVGDSRKIAHHPARDEKIGLLTDGADAVRQPFKRC